MKTYIHIQIENEVYFLLHFSGQGDEHLFPSYNKCQVFFF